MDNSSVIEEVLAVQAGLSPEGPAIGAVHRGWGPIFKSTDLDAGRLSGRFWLTHIDGRPALEHLLLEEGWASIRSRPLDGDLIEVGAPTFQPTIWVGRDDLHGYIPFELMFPSILVAREDDRTRGSLAFNSGIGLGLEYQTDVGPWVGRVGGLVRARHRFGTSKRSNINETQAEWHAALVSPGGVSVGAFVDARTRTEPQDGVRGWDSIATTGGVELGVQPTRGWRSDILVMNPRLDDVWVYPQACGELEIVVEGAVNSTDIQFVGPDGDPFGQMRADGQGTFSWSGPQPRSGGEFTVVAKRLRMDGELPTVDWEASFEADLTTARYLDGDPVTFDLATHGACSRTMGQSVRLTFADGSVAGASIADGVATITTKAVPGPVEVEFLRGDLVTHTEQLSVRPWPACEDADGDGVRSCAGDCDDHDASVSPLARDKPGDGIDNDCDTVNGRDEDLDGWERGQDCDDGDANIHPGAPDLPDGLDGDCDGVVDDTDRDCNPAGPLPQRIEGATDLGTWGVSAFRRTVRVGAPGGWVRFATADFPVLRIETSAADGWTVRVYHDRHADALDRLPYFTVDDDSLEFRSLASGFVWTKDYRYTTGGGGGGGNGLFGALRFFGGVIALPFAVGTSIIIGVDDPIKGVRAFGSYLDFTLGGHGRGTGLGDQPVAPEQAVYWLEIRPDSPDACPLTLTIEAR